MKTRVVSSAEVGSCPMKRWDVNHYLPMHKTDECDSGPGVVCKSCGEDVRVRARRKHLARHNPLADVLPPEVVGAAFLLE